MDAKRRKIIDVQFYKSDAGSIPVKEWLKKLIAADRKNIGDDIRTVEFGWPIGMPLSGPLLPPQTRTADQHTMQHSAP